MKKLVMILIAVATLQASAQDQKREMKRQNMESKTPYSPEEMAQLQTKKMTLHLDLDDKQQKEMSAVLLKQAKLRQSKREAYFESMKKEEKKSLSKEERFKMANERLDNQIETKKTMKTILSIEQFDKWEKMNEQRGEKAKKYGMRNKNKNNRMAPEKAKQ